MSKPSIKERSFLALARAANRIAAWQYTRIEKTQALLDKRKAAHVDGVLLAGDIYADYKAQARDRLEEDLILAEDKHWRELNRANALRKQADYVSRDAQHTYDVEAATINAAIDQLYKETL